ncbi:MAG: DUF4175 family protein [Allomuricauda sp.]|nr:MAG: DUF4175 family protein [Allomuricauda sp.]
MKSYEKIVGKLNQFVSKYYKMQLIKGALLFLALGGSYFLIILALEYFFWMGSTSRLILLIALCLGALYLGYRFIVVPLFYLFRLRKGLSNKEASKLIGKHFSKVNDKLLNLIELAENPHKSELLLASIEQRSRDLETIPFVAAINSRDNLKYAKYVGFPVMLMALIWLSGSIGSFFSSYERVVNYDLAYDPPAPFTFHILNDSLTVWDDQDLVIQVVTKGQLRPEEVYIDLDGESLLMQQRDGIHEYVFKAPIAETTFKLSANEFNSKDYTMRSLNTPALLDFSMQLIFPAYTLKRAENLKGTGNATVPEGTRITWQVSGKHIDELDWSTKDTSYLFNKKEASFDIERSLFQNTAYKISASNQNIRNHEELNYEIAVVRDENPTIKMEQFVDSTRANQLYFMGELGDDYQVTEFRVVTHPVDQPTAIQRLLLQEPKSTFSQVYYTFPSGLETSPGTDYVIYFEAVDNDPFRGGKVSRSQAFQTRVLNGNEIKERELEFQENVLDKFEKSIQRQEEQKETLDKINAEQKQQKNLDFEDMTQIKQFLKQQKTQEDLMQKFTNQLKETLKDELDALEKQLLKERLERQEEKAKKNAELLEELNKIADKIDKEELKKKLEGLGKSQNSSQRNLEQLLELTKRYYVTEKASQLAQKLDAIAKEQEVLSQLKIGEDFSEEQQKKLNEKYDDIDQEIDQLKKDNEGLQKPLDFNIDKQEQNAIQEDQEEALKEINKHQDKEESSESGSDEKQQLQENAAKKQQSAAQKMRELGNKLQQSAAMGGGSTITEDAEMLRQILDNLITFSFKQEALFEQVQQGTSLETGISSTVKKQKELRSLFEHVDDSLFALSLRRAELSEFVNDQITEVYYNLDKSLESIAENQVYQGASYQQYVLNASNSLADFLVKLLDNMQQSMQPGQGSGQGNSDFQLPDIIQGQGELQEKMGQAGKAGKEGQSGEKGENGKQQQEGSSGNKSGNKGKEQNGKEGDKGGQGEEGSQTGTGNGELSEGQLQEVYEIYKEQQYLRQQLEAQLKNMIDESDQELTKKLLRQMEDFENQLLENGITEKTIERANQIQHQLLKLENAALEQGQKQERESNTNNNNFTAPITTRPDVLNGQGSDIEILNRQTLPLRQNYQNRVKQYFKRNDNVPLRE